MTLSENVDKIGNDESIYLIRLLIKKYTRNNILNALYDFICENENVNDISAPFPDKLMNTPAQKSNKKSYHDIDETKICKMDIENGSIDNNFEFNLLADDEKKIDYQSKNFHLLRKKRKNSSKNLENCRKSQRLIQKKEKEDQNNSQDESEKENKNKKKLINNRKKAGAKILLRKNKNSKLKRNGKLEQTYDYKEEMKIGGGSEMSNEEEDEKEEGLKKNNKDKNQLNYTSFPVYKSKSFEPIISKSDRKLNLHFHQKNKILSGDEVIKSENNDNINSKINKNNISKSSKKVEKKENININIELNPDENDTSNYRNHMIKVVKDKPYVYSYKMKKCEITKGKMKIFFECNNKKCKGKGEYNVNKKIFKETAEHTSSIGSHKMTYYYFDLKNLLLKDNECDGYQILKDYSFIKDSKVIRIK
jgi:hypothetical protein